MHMSCIVCSTEQHVNTRYQQFRTRNTLTNKSAATTNMHWAPLPRYNLVLDPALPQAGLALLDDCRVARILAVLQMGLPRVVLEILRHHRVCLFSYLVSFVCLETTTSVGEVGASTLPSKPSRSKSSLHSCSTRMPSAAAMERLTNNDSKVKH